MTPPQEQDPQPNKPDPLPGRVIAGNFRIDKLIGSGAMGNVYKAEQLSLGKAVAVKVLHAHLMDDEKLVMRFKREAKSASLLNHANSIQIIDSGQDGDGTLYIAMELLAGRDLAQVIRDDFPLPLPRVVRIMSQVLAALDEAHAMGVIHRDLKPSNIMLIERRGAQDFVKVCDFGIAKAQSPDGKEEDRQAMLTIQGLVCGTPEYMAPEQARAEPLDGRADLYAAAVILYQLVTGDIPFRADSPMGLVSRHLVEPPQPPSQRRTDLPIPKVIDDIVLRGMEKQREQRYPTANAFREALEAVVSTAPGQLTPFPPGVRAAMPTAVQLDGAVATSETAVVAAKDAGRKFGSTADLAPARARSKVPLVTVLSAALGLGAIAAAVAMRPRPDPRAGRASVVEPALAWRAAAPAVAVPPPAVLPPPAAPAPPVAAAEPAAAPPPAAMPEAPAAPAPARAHTHHHRSVEHAGTAAVIAAPAGAGAAGAITPVVPAAPTAIAEAAPARGPREVLAEGERLLGQGEVKDACARGEEAKHMSPKLPAIYKFLGKCYMREGNTGQAADNYKKYLELAPTASDAPFIKSIIK